MAPYLPLAGHNGFRAFPGELFTRTRNMSTLSCPPASSIPLPRRTTRYLDTGPEAVHGGLAQAG